MSEQSILKDVRRSSGLDDSDDSFDADLLLYINGAIGSMNQQGVGETGLRIKDALVRWDDLFTPEEVTTAIPNLVQEYIGVQVRVLFDPPQPSALGFMTARLRELEWRAQVEASILAKEEVRNDSSTEEET